MLGDTVLGTLLDLLWLTSWRCRLGQELAFLTVESPGLKASLGSGNFDRLSH